MSFKDVLWNFKASDLQEVLGQGMKLFYHQDASSEYFITRKIREQKKQQDWIVFQGAEVKIDWLEDRLLGLDLFGASENILILEGNSLGAQELDFFIANYHALQERYILIHFNKNKAVLNKKLGKNIPLHVIDSIPFWKVQEAIEYFCHELDFSLSFSQRQILSQYVEESYDGIYQRLLWLKNQQLLDIDDASFQKYLQSFLQVDPFALADDLNLKKIDPFFLKLSQEASYKEMEKLIAFSISHLLKISEISYLEGKKSLSKYDQKIQKAHQLWRRGEIAWVLKSLAELQKVSRVSSGKENLSFIQGLRLSYLKKSGLSLSTA